MKDIIKKVSLLLLGLITLSNTIYAKEKVDFDEFVLEYNFDEDEFSGPGIGILTNTWDGSLNNRIYSYGSLNNIIGDEIVNALAYSCDGPGTESAKLPSVVYNAVGPGFMINTHETEYQDMGPQVVDTVISPDDYIKISNASIKDLAEASVSLNNAKNKENRKSK